MGEKRGNELAMRFSRMKGIQPHGAAKTKTPVHLVMRRHCNSPPKSPRQPIPLLKFIELQGRRCDVLDVFGLILFTNAHPFVKKALRDDDLWASLGSVSGPRWPIFALRPKSGRYTSFPPTGFALNSLIELPTVWEEPLENQIVLKELGVEDTSKLPLLLIFTKLRSGSIGQIYWRFKPGDNVEECYKSLRDTIESARSAIDQVTAENIKNNDEVLELMRTAHLQHRILEFASNIPTLASWAKELFDKLKKT